MADSWQRKIRKELEAQFRADQRARLKQLQAKIREAKQQKREALKAVTASCRRLSKRHAARIRKSRTDARLRINAERDELSQRRKASCSDRRTSAAGTHDKRIGKLQSALKQERGRQRTYRIYTSPAKLRGPKKAREAAAESDSQVERNIDAELLPVWKAVKRKIKATPNASRTEAFEQWVHDHPARVKEIVEQDAEHAVQQWVAQEAEERQRLEGLGSLDDSELLARHDETRFDQVVPF